MDFTSTRCWFLPLLDIRHCRKLSLYSISKKTQENSEKPHFGPDLGPLDLNSGRYFFFNLASSITRYHGELSTCKTSEKTNDLI